MKPDPNYPILHDIARHSIHVCETLDLAVTTSTSILIQRDRFFSSRLMFTQEILPTLEAHEQKLRFYDHMLRSLKQRAESNRQRLVNEINLVGLLRLCYFR
jgi:hypothetical protein